MFETRKYGPKYDEALNTKQIAAKVRQDIKEAIKAGQLPTGKYSVRMQRFAGGSSIDVYMSDLNIKLFSEGYLKEGETYLNGGCTVDGKGNVKRPSRHSEEAIVTREKVDAILNAYNHDGSDSMTDHFDVKFYGSVEFSWSWHKAKFDSEKAELGA